MAMTTAAQPTTCGDKRGKHGFISAGHHLAPVSYISGGSAL